MPDLSAQRISPFAIPAIYAGKHTITALPPASRFVFRGKPEAVSFGPALPTDPCRAAEADGQVALWLGPDEWLLIGPEGAEAPAATAGSVVEISHRQVALSLAGPQLGRLLNAGCPLDLDLLAFPVGRCTRTIFAKVEIVLWRRSETEFRVEVARSFAAYLAQYLEEVVRELDI